MTIRVNPGDGAPRYGCSKDILRAGPLRDGDHRRRVPRQQPRRPRPRRAGDRGVSDLRRTYVPAVGRLWSWQPLHRRPLFREPGRMSVHGRRRLRVASPLHARPVLRQPGRKPVLRAEPVREPRPLHGRHVLRQRERVPVQRDVRLRAELGVRQREVQLTDAPARPVRASTPRVADATARRCRPGGGMKEAAP